MIPALRVRSHGRAIEYALLEYALFQQALPPGRQGIARPETTLYFNQNPKTQPKPTA
jgi:hypothetical protein